MDINKAETIQNKKINIFLCYTSKDEKLCYNLQKHLRSLQKQDIVYIWHKRLIEAGAEWKNEIDQQLDAAHIVLLLVSPDFMDSEYCYETEMKQAMKRHEQGTVRVIPIILHPVDWMDTPFGKLRALPTMGKPVSKWRNQNEAFVDITRGIRNIIENIQFVPLTQPFSPAFIHATPNLDQDTHVQRIDWGQAPHAKNFYGRDEERASLVHWMRLDKCQVVALVGIGGIGKTALAAAVVKQLEADFQYIQWRSLQNAPPIEVFLQDCIQFVSDQEQVKLPTRLDDQITVLINCLHNKHCLLILDNFDSILQGDRNNFAGSCREGYEGYGLLVQRIGEANHQSSLLLTSRETPNEVALLEGKTTPVHVLNLLGLEFTEGKHLLEDKGLMGNDEVLSALINIYSGNPLALKIVSQLIREIFEGDITEFLKAGGIVFGSIQALLDQQFKRLSELEVAIMYWLAIEREPTSLEILREDIISFPLKGQLLSGLASLRQRSFLEVSRHETTYFTLQPVLMEYTTLNLIEQIVDEILNEKVIFLDKYVLIKAQAKAYIRYSQDRMILSLIVEKILNISSKKEIERIFGRILIKLHQMRHQGYIATNILSLLLSLKSDLRAYDFSYLHFRQAYLQNAKLADTNFAHATFTKSIFIDVFKSIVSLAFSHDGTFLAAGTWSGDVIVWNTSDHNVHFVFRKHTDLAHSVAFNSDSSILASGGDDNIICLWEMSTGRYLSTLEGHTSYISCVAFSPDGKFLASSSNDTTTRLWEADTGRCLFVLQGHRNVVASIAFSPNGRTIASGSDDGTIRLWETATAQCIRTITTDAKVSCVAFSPDGRIIASSGIQATIHVWNASTGQEIQVLRGHSEWVWSLVFSPDGKLLASGSADKTIRLWEVDTSRCIRLLPGHTNRVRAVVFSPDGQTVGSGSEDRTVRLWEVNTGLCIHTLQGYANQIWSIALRPDCQVIATGDEEMLRLWRVSTGQLLQALQGYESWIRSVNFSHNGNMLASGATDGTIRLWDAHTGQYLHTFYGHVHWVLSVDFNFNDQVLASGSADSTIRIWKVDTGHIIHTLQDHSDMVMTVAFSPDGKLLASGGADRTVRLWNVASGQCLHILQGHDDWAVWSVAFSPDGKLLASGSDDQTVRLWDVTSGHLLYLFQGQTSRIWSVAFSPDGKLLACGDNDAIHLWELNTHSRLRVLQGHTHRVRITFSADSSMIVSGSQDGTIKLWDVQTGICLKTLISDRPYERMNLTGVYGLTEGQKDTLRALGAIGL